MTEEQLHKQTEQEQLEQKASADKLPEKKRRRLIKGAAAAIPVIMTLHSGAALARTSNLMGPELNIGEAELFDGNLICVVPDTSCEDCGTDLGNGTVDLGNFPTAHYDDTKKDGIPDLVKQAQICDTRQGFLVSATGAWASVAPKTGVPNKFI